MLDLTQEQRRLIEGIIFSVFSKDVEISIYGSRVTGKARPYSDLDILLKASAPLSLEQMAEIKDKFSESNLPFLVDITDWNNISNDFKERITTESVSL